MNNHGLIVGMLIVSLVAVIALFVWRAFMGVKHKNNAEWKAVITKARAFSALSLWVVKENPYRYGKDYRVCA